MNKKEILTSTKEEKKERRKTKYPCRFCDGFTDGKKYIFAIGKKKVDTFVCPTCKEVLNGKTICVCQKCGDLWLEPREKHAKPCVHKSSCKNCDPNNQQRK